MRFLMLSVVLLLPVASSACDFCNCYLGLDPGYNKNTIGFRTNYRTSEYMMPGLGTHKNMHGNHGSDSESGGEKLHESFLGFELYARYYPVSKLQLMLTLPYQINTLEFGEQTETATAFSDMTLIAMYQIANTMTIDSNSVRHRLFGGLGIKFPTGKSSGTKNIDIPMAHDLYSGTGSTDYLAILSYIGKVRKFGWNADASFKYNCESCNDYKYGNTFNVTPRLFYETAIKSVKILPHVGGAYEFSAHDQYEGEEIHETGGNVFWGSAGVDFYFGKISFSTDVRLPVYQELGEMVPEDKYWLFGSLNFHF